MARRIRNKKYRNTRKIKYSFSFILILVDPGGIGPPLPRSLPRYFSGPCRNRTGDLLYAIETLYQLSQRPKTYGAIVAFYRYTTGPEFLWLF